MDAGLRNDAGSSFVLFHGHCMAYGADGSELLFSNKHGGITVCSGRYSKADYRDHDRSGS